MPKPVKIKIPKLKVDDSIWEKFDKVVDSLPSGLYAKIVDVSSAPVMVIAMEEHPIFLFQTLNIIPRGDPTSPGWQLGEENIFERLCEEARKKLASNDGS